MFFQRGAGKRDKNSDRVRQSERAERRRSFQESTRRDLQIESLEERRVLAALGGVQDLLGSDLAQVYTEYESSTASGPSNTGGGGFQSSRTSDFLFDGDSVFVEVRTNGDFNAMQATLSANGFQQAHAAPGGLAVDGFLPIAALTAVANDPNIYLYPVWQDGTNAQGSAANQAEQTMFADLAKMLFGIDGTGVTVGVISDTANSVAGGLADSVASGNLPMGVTQVVADMGPGIDEGRAMLELVHDIAQGATLQFASGQPFSDVAIGAAIDALRLAGSDVIVDDLISIRNQPWFQDGVASQAVTAAFNAGIPYFSSAGNRGTGGFETPTNFSNSTVFGINGDFQDFDLGAGVDYAQTITLAPGNNTIYFQYDQALGGVTSDLDIRVYTMGGVLIDDGIDLNTTTQRPWENVTVNNPGPGPMNVQLTVQLFSGAAPTRFKWINIGGSPNGPAELTGQPGTFVTGHEPGHSGSANAIAVGAANFATPTTPEGFTSVGPTSRSLTPAGAAMPLQIIQNPNLTAHDGVSTSVPLFGSFFGTSAAAPNAAAIAALMLDVNPTLTPTQIATFLANTATDIGAPGFDNVTGAGLVNGVRAVLAANGGVLELHGGAGASNDNIAIRVNAGNPALLDVIYGGVTQGQIPLADIVSIEVTGLGGDDTFTVDYANGSPVPLGGISYDGGAGTNDSMEVINYNVGQLTVTHAASPVNGPFSGTVQVGAGAPLISFSGIEPLLNAGTAADIIYNLPGTNDVASLEDDGVAANNMSRLRSVNGTFETTTFTNPTNSLTINAGGGLDTVNLVGFDAPVVPLLTINGDAGDDIIDATTFPIGAVTTMVLNGNANNDTIRGHAGVETINGGTGDDTIIGNRGNDLLFGDDNNDTFIWNNGDGADDVVGGNGLFDQLIFNGASPGADTLIVDPAGVASGQPGDGTLGGADVQLTRTAPTGFTIEMATLEDIFINSLDGDDTITVNDLTAATSLFTVNVDGGPHTAGDILNVDAAGQDVTLLAGAVDLPGVPDVFYTNIETVNLLNANHVSYDGTAIGDEMVLTGADSLPAAFDASFTVDQTLDNATTGAVPRINVDAASFQFNAQGGNDRLLLDATIDGLPTFTAAHPGGHTNAAYTAETNPAFGGVAPVVGLDFDGGLGADAIGLNVPGAAAVGYYSDTLEAANSGNLRINSVVGISFDELAPIDIIGAGALVIDATATPATTFLSIADDAATPGAFLPFDILINGGAAVANDGVNSIWGNGGFETTRFVGFTTVTVRGGDGSETIRLGPAPGLNLDAGAGSPTTYNLTGENTTGTDGAPDTIIIDEVPAGVTVNAFGGGGADIITVGAPTATLDQIVGLVNADGGVGADILNVNDAADVNNNNYVVRPTSVVRDNAGPQVTVNYTTIETVNLQAGLGNDKVVAQPSLNTVYNLNGGPPTGPYGTIPGDTFSVNPIGTSIASAPTGVTAGTVTFNGGFQNVNFADFEWTVFPDRFENNDNANGFPDPNIADLSVKLGSLPEVTLNGLSIHGPDDPNTPLVVEDVDYFQYTAHSTGKLIVRALFEHEFGDLELTVLDSTGAIIATSNTSNNANDQEEIIIPVVSQQVYYILVNGVMAPGDTCNVNNYDLEIENFAAPIPNAIDLVIEDDSGMMNNDNVTNIDTATVVVEVDLQNYAAMGIPILTAAQAAAGNVPGVAVEVFVQRAFGAPVLISAGFADPVNNDLFRFTFAAGDLVGGPAGAPFFGEAQNLVKARVVVIDGQTGPVANVQGATELSEPLEIRLDQTAPAAPTAPALLPSSDSGLLGDGLTNKMQPAFDGTAEPNSKIFLYANGRLVGATVADSDGNWEITSEPLVDGVYQITSDSLDLAGNRSVLSGAFALTIDATAPQRPTIDLQAATDTGSSSLDNVTMGVPAGTTTYTVTAEVGSNVVVKDGNTVIFGPFVSAGVDVINLALADGSHLLSTEATDAAGNRSAQAEELVVTMDTLAPLPTTPVLAPYSDSGILGDGLTNKMQPAFVGLAEANSLVRLFANGVQIGEARVGSDESDGILGNGLGVWEITSEPLVDGVYVIDATVEDQAGNISALGAPFNLTIDSEGPQRPTIDLTNPDDTGWSEFDNVTIGDPTQGPGIVEFRITGDIGDTVVVKDGDQILNGIGTVPAAIAIPAAGFVIVTVDFNAAGMPFPAEGPHPMTAETTDGAGNIKQSEDLLVEVDFTAPGVPFAFLAPYSDTGILGDGITNKMQPAITGLAEANSVVRVYVDDGINGPILAGVGVVGSDESDISVGGTNVDGLGIWEVTLEPLRDATYTVTVEVEDQAGNVSPLGGNFQITIDSTLPQRPTVDLVGTTTGDPLLDLTGNPAVPVVVPPTPSDTGWSSFDNVTFGLTPVFAANQQGTTTIQLRISAEPGATVDIKDGEDIIATFTMPPAQAIPDPGNFVFYTLTLDEDPHPISVEVTDASGNRVQSEELLIEIDTTAPVAPTIALATHSDTGAIGDGITSISQPTFTGFAEPNSKVILFNLATGEIVGEGITNTFGVWSVTVAPLSNNDYAIGVVAEDQAGNISTQAQTNIVVDPYEPNDVIANATVLGSPETVTLNNVTIHNGADVDFFRYTAHSTGKLLVNLLPQDVNADLDLQILDAAGNVIAASALGIGAPESLAIPVVGQQQYFIRVFAFAGAVADRSLYDLEVENFGTPTPTDVTLHPTDDSGMMNTDLVTFVQDGVLFIQADLEDYSIMGVTLLSAAQANAGNVPGAAVQLFINGVASGYADPVLGSTTLWSIELDTLANANPLIGQWSTAAPFAIGYGAPVGPTALGWLQMVSSAVRIFDGATPTRNARGQLSPVTRIQFDPNAPDENLATIVMLNSSDSGVIGDNITNKMSPAFTGVAEANTKIRLFADLLGDAPDAGPQIIGETVVKSDLSNGVFNDGLGRWEITVEPLIDGVYNLYLDLEDVAGNFSGLLDTGLQITIDTLPPQRPTVDLVGKDVADAAPDMTGNPAVPVNVPPAPSDTGWSYFDNVTFGLTPLPAAGLQGETTVQLRISAEPGQLVIIKDGEDIIGQFVMPVGLPVPPGPQQPGNFVFYTVALDEDPHPLSVEVFDIAGNRSAQSEELLVTVDTTVPAATAAPDMLASSDSGMFDNDNVTSINTPAFSGVAEINTLVRIFAQAVNPANGANVGAVQEIGQTIVGSDLTDGVAGNMLGTWEITVEPLDDGVWRIFTQVEDQAGNIGLTSAVTEIEIDTYVPNTPFIDLREQDDSGRHNDDNITNVTNPVFFLTTHDPNLANHIDLGTLDGTPFLKYRIYDRPEGAVAETLIYDSNVTLGGLTALLNVTTPALALSEGYHNLKVEVEDRAGNISDDFFLTVVIDTIAPPVSITAIKGGFDSGVTGMPATLVDRITNNTNPVFFGSAEADAIVRLYADAVANNAIDLVNQFRLVVADPLDGDDAFPNGQWSAMFTRDLNDPNFFPNLDGLREILVQAEDVAGNVSTIGADDVLQVFIDTQGPRVYDPAGAQAAVHITDNPATVRDESLYNLFDPKPSVDGPTPLVESITVHIEDLPARVTGFLYDAIKAPGSVLNGFFLPDGVVSVVGDANGVIPIDTVQWISDPVVNGQVATGRLVINFFDALPDDRFTLTILDSVTDPAGNALDGEMDTPEPQESPTYTFPSGDGVPGGDFVARFTVDTRPEVGTWAGGVVWVDTNGNTTWDPNNVDFTNRDIAYTIGFTTDDVFAGNFSAIGAAAADGFDKIAAYGRYQGAFRWLIDIDNDGAVDLDITDPANVNGLPFAGNFDGNAANGDEVGLFDGANHRFWFDTNHDYRVDTFVVTNMRGYPVVGDFDGNGTDDLATWTDDTFQIDLTGDAQFDAQFRFGFIGVRERPVAADFNMDGFADLGLWQPNGAGVTPGEGSEWFLLVSGDLDGDGDPSLLDRIRFDARLNLNVIDYTPTPFGFDQYLQFGDDFALPVVGNFDPPVTSEANPRGNINFNLDNVYDVNQDGAVDLNDLRELLSDQVLNGSRQLLSQLPTRVDVNRDGFATPGDMAVELQQLILLANAEGELDAEGEAPTYAPLAGVATASVGGATLELAPAPAATPDASQADLVFAAQIVVNDQDDARIDSMLDDVLDELAASWDLN